MKRALLLAFALFCAADGQAKGPSPGEQWTCSLDNVADSLTLCIASANTTLRRYITDIVAQSTTGTAGLFQLQYNRSVASGGIVNCGTDGVTIFPAGLDAASAGRFAATANTQQATAVQFSNPLIVPANKDLCILGDASNAVTVQVIGYLAP